MEATQEQTQLQKLIDERIKSAIAEEQTRTNKRFRMESENKIYGLLVVCWVLFGIFGGHRIYAGRWDSVKLTLLLCVATFGSGFVAFGQLMVVSWISMAVLPLWALFDLFMILTKQYKNARGVTIG